jgi:hypothetical protein
VSFRQAETRDAELLWRWRLRDEQQPWYGGVGTTYGTHEAWFSRNRSRVRIWEENGKPVGAVRVESDGSLHFTGSGDTATMLRAATVAANSHGGRLKADVDERDIGRMDALVAAGFQEFPARGFIYKP